MIHPMDTLYPVIQIHPDWVLEEEAMGSKEKFWFRENDDGPDWLFKYPQANTGQHWAEKIAAEVAGCLDILHARVELAEIQGEWGSATESFARDGRDLHHGNQILAGQLLDYDPNLHFHQSSHTLANIFEALDRVFQYPEGRHRAKEQLAEYLVLDAVIGNTDRHHENWGILRKRTTGGWKGIVAPTFDHASSLGRELLDDTSGKCRYRILHEGRVPQYSEKAPGAIYWQETDRRGISPLELVRRGAQVHPDLFGNGLIALKKLDEGILTEIVTRVPNEWMSEIARTFALRLMCYNLEQLRKIAT